ncbi:MAG: RagB/SusD family nutrient uptake outer membrane protein, partial [Chitinophagaceae bacterium]|nr:RagB/SusD family nutrient uptake outer membrane protein [Chitinophagaceae bacterium]
GDVPKIDFRVYTAADGQRPKAPAAEIYALIDADLQFAAANLPANWRNAAGGNRFPGRLTKGAANGLLAKTQLYRRNWAAALSAAQAVINSGEYSLAQNFGSIWTTAGENNSESLFEIQASVGQSGADNFFSWHAIAQGVRGSGDWDLGWGWNTPTEKLVNDWSDSDPRKRASILFSGQPDRYADVLLIAAEAANELGGAANQRIAEDMLELVRARARGGDNTILPKVVFQDQSQMRTAIQNERRFELALEGDRFFDLVRWGLAPTVLGGAGYTNRHRFYPIPQQAIDNSGGKLIQNPEWQ